MLNPSLTSPGPSLLRFDIDLEIETYSSPGDDLDITGTRCPKKIVHYIGYRPMQKYLSNNINCFILQ